jgi:hypothetical protein
VPEPGEPSGLSPGWICLHCLAEGSRASALAAQREVSHMYIGIGTVVVIVIIVLIVLALRR